MTWSWSLPATATPGERLFAAYLNQRGLDGEYEPLIGGSRPDFRVELPSGSPLVAEVYEPQELADTQGGWRDPAHLAGKLFRNKHKARQIAAAHGKGFPVLCVLADTNSAFTIEPFETAIAMFGRDAALRSDHFTDVSAVGVIRKFNPTAWRLECSALERLGRRADGAPAASLVPTYLTAERELLRSAYRNDARQAYLTLLINPFADYSFDCAAFEGSYDERWDQTGRESPYWYDQVWQGAAIFERKAS